MLASASVLVRSQWVYQRFKVHGNEHLGIWNDTDRKRECILADCDRRASFTQRTWTLIDKGEIVNLLGLLVLSMGISTAQARPQRQTEQLNMNPEFVDDFLLTRFVEAFYVPEKQTGLIFFKSR